MGFHNRMWPTLGQEWACVGQSERSEYGPFGLVNGDSAQESGGSTLLCFATNFGSDTMTMSGHSLSSPQWMAAARGRARRRNVFETGPVSISMSMLQLESPRGEHSLFFNAPRGEHYKPRGSDSHEEERRNLFVNSVGRDRWRRASSVSRVIQSARRVYPRGRFMPTESRDAGLPSRKASERTAEQETNVLWDTMRIDRVYIEPRSCAFIGSSLPVRTA